MENKGYTIMEAVIAMFLVLVMVGAVFSALMAGRRAISTSSEKEEVFYTLQSAYGMLKDCRANPGGCHLKKIECFNSSSGDWKNCSDLFTFNFKSVCKNEDGEGSKFQYNITPVDGAALDWVCKGIGEDCTPTFAGTYKYQTVDIQATCQEEDE